MPVWIRSEYVTIVSPPFVNDQGAGSAPDRVRGTNRLPFIGSTGNSIPQNRGNDKRRRVSTASASFVCAYVVQLLPLFLPLSTQFWSGKGSITQDSQSPQTLENRTFREKPGLERMLFSQFKSCIVHQQEALEP